MTPFPPTATQPWPLTMGTKAGNEGALAADGIASWSGSALTFFEGDSDD